MLKQWYQMLGDRNILLLIGIPVTLFLHNAACFGFWCGVIIFSCYFMGIYCCSLITKKWLSSIAKRFHTAIDTETEHDFPTDYKKEKVPGQVYASSSIDRALDQIFCRIADQYISTWYTNISNDNWFQYEIRSAIRRIVGVLYHRIARINLEHFVLDKVVPVCLAHAHAVTTQQNVEISRLHVAVHSRKSEVLYAQNISKSMLKFLLPASDFNCKSYGILLREIVSKSIILSLSDAICNPCILNQLILRHLEFHGKGLPSSDEDSDTGDIDSEADVDSSNFSDNCNDEPIQLLNNFTSFYNTLPNNGFLRPDVNSILKDKELQSTFMRYLRSQNAEHVLQFCLDIASFNEKILKPDLEGEELDNLYRDAWDLFSVYFKTDSPNCINFDKDLASPLRKALSKDILKLRTTATLFEAYEYAFSVLENYCQDFHNSAEFYRWLYGRCDSPDLTCLENVSSTQSSSGLRSGVPKESFGRKTMAEIGQKFSKFKEVLKSESVLEGRIYGGNNGEFSSGTNDPQEYRCTEVGVDVQLSAVTESKNINKWKISIPTLTSRTDPVTNTMHTILVVRITNENDVEWFVERRPVDIHSLNSKLISFHGEPTADFQLPTLKVSSSQTTTTMENVQAYEEYLKKLTACVKLNDSDLLYDFLTSVDPVNDDDDDVDDDGVVDVEDGYDYDYECEESSFGKMFRKSVVPTLRRERGQNLETFVNSLIGSCVTNRSKNEWKDNGVVGEIKPSNKKVYFDLKSSHLYGNNFDVDANRTRETVLANKTTNFTNQPCLTPFSLVIHFAYKIYNLRMEFVRILICLKSAFGNLVDRFIFKITDWHLKNITKERNIAYFINTIECKYGKMSM